MAGSWAETDSAFLPASKRTGYRPLTLHESLASNINYLKTVAACLPLLIWAFLFKGAELAMESDNSYAVFLLSHRTCKSLGALKWHRIIFYASCADDFGVAS